MFAQRTMICRQILYESVATSFMTLEDVVPLLQKCNQQNFDIEISGLLIFHNNRFMQLLEGSKARIEFIMGKISNDPRHSNLKVLHETECTQRSMGAWAMAFTMDTNKSEALREYPFFLSIADAREICSTMKSELSQHFSRFLET